QRVQSRCRQEADPPQVDAQNAGVEVGEQTSAAEQRTVSTEGEQRVEPDRVEVGNRTGPEWSKPGLGEQGNAAGQRLASHALEDGCEICIPRIADDPDLHRASRLSS